MHLVKGAPAAASLPIDNVLCAYALARAVNSLVLACAHPARGLSWNTSRPNRKKRPALSASYADGSDVARGVSSWRASRPSEPRCGGSRSVALFGKRAAHAGPADGALRSRAWERVGRYGATARRPGKARSSPSKGNLMRLRSPSRRARASPLRRARRALAELGPGRGRQSPSRAIAAWARARVCCSSGRGTSDAAV
jgi:hypothetical protein